MKTITSFSNPKIKELAALRESRERKRTGLTIIEGLREIRAALTSQVSIEEIYLCPEMLGEKKNAADAILEKAAIGKAEVFQISRGLYEKICFGERGEGMLAVGKPEHKVFSHIKLSKNPLVMIIEAIEKPGNLGAIVRSCDASGIEALFVADPATDIYNPHVIRASLGTVFNVPVIVEDKQKILDFSNREKMKIVAATPSAKQEYFRYDFRKATAIAVGSEKEGLSDFWLKHAGEKVRIPMRGQADSLNASVSAAVLAYEALRQRMQ